MIGRGDKGVSSLAVMAWRDFVEEVSEPMLLLLLGVGVLYVLFGRLLEAGFVWAIVLAIAGIEVLNERRADVASVRWLTD